VLTPRLVSARDQYAFGGNVSASALADDELRAGLSDQRERFVQVLRDLELDFQTEKISAEDYASMRASVSAELGQVLSRLDENTSRNSLEKSGQAEVE
jgi:hypothetical protein